MAAAWIAFRTPEAAREWWDSYRSKRWIWRPKNWRVPGGRVYEGHFLEQPPRATLALLGMLQFYDPRPYRDPNDARAELVEQRPDAVVLDINLGHGPTFKLAEVLKDQGIPFVFVTGYGHDVIPGEFDDIERLEKPAHLRRIVSAIAKLVDSSGAILPRV
jgi:hypothetical protein